MFIDNYSPAFLQRYEFFSVPRWSTNIVAVANGKENRNQNWVHPLRRYTAPSAVSCFSDLMDLQDMWMVTRGPLNTFPLVDPFDFASAKLQTPNVAPTITRLDQSIGTGDGMVRSFQLSKRYEYGGQVYRRDIYLPVVESVLVAINGLDPNDLPESMGGPNPYTVARRGGIITFERAPPVAAAITAGFLFDVEVRFEADDSLDIIAKAVEAGATSDVNFVEVRPC